MTLLRDERGQVSAARVALFAALAFEFAYIPVFRNTDSIGVVLAYFTALDTALIAWTAGSRIAQYIGPQVGAAAQGVGNAAHALAEKVAARRHPTDGYEESR